MNFLENNSSILPNLINDPEQANEIKRRKAEEIDRVYICQFKNCNKSYGSYPALYTHIKLKHQNSMRKVSQGQSPSKNCQYIKRIAKTQTPPKLVTSSSSLLQSRPHDAFNCKPLKLDVRTLNELYQDLLSNLQATLSFDGNQSPLFENEFSPKKQTDSQTQEITQLCSEEFPSIQSLNQDILFPLKAELLSLASPQTFVKTSAQQACIAHKLAEVLAFLGTKITQELYFEFCYFLGFFAKCIALRKIRNISVAEEDFQQIYEYIHDSIGYCTTFRFKYLKNGKILENKNELTKLTKEIIRIIILITLKEEKEQEQPSQFILQ